MQPGDGFESITFYTQDMQDYRESIWSLNEKISAEWNLGQVKISRDYDFMILVEILSTGQQTGQIAIDDFITVQDEVCDTIPAQAKPIGKSNYWFKFSPIDGICLCRYSITMQTKIRL